MSKMVFNIIVSLNRVSFVIDVLYYPGPARVTGGTIDRTMGARESHHCHPPQ